MIGPGGDGMAPRPQMLTSSTARQRKSKTTADWQKEVAKLVEKALGLGFAVTVLRAEHETCKDEGRRIAKRKGRKTTDEHLVVSLVFKYNRYIIDCAPQFEYETNRDKFIQLVGLERAATCMELLSYTHLLNLAKAGQLVTPSGKQVTEADIKKITKKRKRPVMKVSFEKKPILSGTALASAMHPSHDVDDD